MFSVPLGTKPTDHKDVRLTVFQRMWLLHRQHIKTFIVSLRSLHSKPGGAFQRWLAFTETTLAFYSRLSIGTRRTLKQRPLQAAYLEYDDNKQVGDGSEELLQDYRISPNRRSFRLYF